jgi:hypothetical protein
VGASNIEIRIEFSPPASVTLGRAANHPSMSFSRLNAAACQFLISLQEIRDGT